jgi:hypothetical protein
MNRSIKRLALIPLHLLEVFTWSKSFRSNPVIGSYVLNRLGLHVFRVVLAHLLFRFRLFLLSPLVAPEDRRQFLEQGYIVKRDFLALPQFAALVAEVANYRGEIREIVEGDTATQRLFLTHEVRRNLPECDRLMREPRLDRLLRYASSKNRPPFFFIENLKQHAGAEGRADPQKDLHMDTFHPCVKAWLYLDDVSDRNGPFIYVPGSHRLSWARLKWEYRESLTASRERALVGPRYWDGSFRVAREDLSAMGLPAPLALQVPANTLVLANVYGFHGRGDAAQPSTRRTIWMQARDNPFNPLFTPFPRMTARLFERVWDRYQKSLDRKRFDDGMERTYRGRFEQY